MAKIKATTTQKQIFFIPLLTFRPLFFIYIPCYSRQTNYESSVPSIRTVLLIEIINIRLNSIIRIAMALP